MEKLISGKRTTPTVPTQSPKIASFLSTGKRRANFSFLTKVQKKLIPSSL